MKGIEFPISTILVIIIVLAVGITILYVFSGALTPPANSTTLDMATKATCAKISLFTDKMMWARIPVDNFDANKNGNVNDRTPDPGPPTLPTSKGDDNLESLCKNFYNCDWASVNWDNWRQCCITRICGKII